MAADMNMMQLMEQFGTDKKCLAILEELHWPNGVTCKRCKSRKVSRIHKRDQFDCDSCRYQFSVTAGTIFHDTHLPLQKWFVAIYLMVESRKGMSANQMKRTIGVSYKTAWYLCHRIRAAMHEMNAEKLKGVVEADETFIGGRNTGGGRGTGAYIVNKAIVAGIVERGGKLRMSVIPNTLKQTLHRFVQMHADDLTKMICTDENRSYRGLADKNTKHETVNHVKKEWVRGVVHTNTIEGVWSLLKRSIVGSYHQVSKKHLDAYLDELEWRFNNRKNPWLFRNTLKKLLGSGKLEYQDLIAS